MKQTEQAARRIENEIELYLHCNECLREARALGDTPTSYARTQIGVTKTGGLQVWCNRHNLNVLLVDEPQKIAPLFARRLAHGCEDHRGGHST